MNIFVTVGMSSWPFDRLIRAIEPLCHDHQVFVQTGTSTVTPPCPHAPFVTYPEFLDQIRSADLIITHAGNTVRVAQRAGKVPIAVAREEVQGEMANDHQVEYLRHEAQVGRVVAVWDVATLPAAVATHVTQATCLFAERALAAPADRQQIAAELDALWDSLLRNPFRRHPLRRYAFAWDALTGRMGRHIDVTGDGEFAATLASTTALECQALLRSESARQRVRMTWPEVSVEVIASGGRWPYPDAHAQSITLLEPDAWNSATAVILHEVQRVLEPDGLLVLALLSNVAGRQSQLRARLAAYGFTVERESSAHRCWRWARVPSIPYGRQPQRLLDRAIWLDGDLFRHAQWLVCARRVA